MASPGCVANELVAFYTILSEDEVLPEHLCGLGALALAPELSPN
jgi:hypothetical protein